MVENQNKETIVLSVSLSVSGKISTGCPDLIPATKSTCSVLTVRLSVRFGRSDVLSEGALDRDSTDSQSEYYSCG